jgi:hypothetical protein
MHGASLNKDSASPKTTSKILIEELVGIVIATVLQLLLQLALQLLQL